MGWLGSVWAILNERMCQQSRKIIETLPLSRDTYDFCLHGPFLPLKILKIIFYDGIGIKTNTIQTGFIVMYHEYYIHVFLLILKGIKIKTFSWTPTSIVGPRCSAYSFSSVRCSLHWHLLPSPRTSVHLPDASTHSTSPESSLWLLEAAEICHPYPTTLKQ